MRKKALLGAAILVLVAAVVVAANVSCVTGAKATCPMQKDADKPCGFMPVSDTAKQMFGPKLEGLKKALGLTAEQEQKIAAIYKQFMADEAGVIGDMKALRGEYHKLVIGGASKAQIADKVDRITALQSKLMLDAADRFAEVRAVLTPAQQKTLADKAAQFCPMLIMGGCRCAGKCECAAGGTVCGTCRCAGKCECSAGGMICETGVGCRAAGGKPPMVPGGGLPGAARK